MNLIKKQLRIVIIFGIFSLLSSLVIGSTIGASSIIDTTSLVQPTVTNLHPSISGVTHDPTTPDSGQVIYISATITDSDGLSSTMLYYRAQGATGFNSTGMTKEGSSDVYGTNIGPYVAGLTVEYYIFAVDASASHLPTTEDNGGEYYSFTVVPADNEAPAITNVQHSPETPTDDDLINIGCNVSDASEVIVKLNFRVDEGEWSNITMTNYSGTYYNTTVGEFDAGTLFEYRIYAIDQSRNNNTNLENAGGENYYFTVIVNDVVAPIIINIIHEPEVVHILETVTITCDVTDAANGILNVTLYYSINGGAWDYEPFTGSEEDGYTVTIGPFEVDAIIEYFVEAFDDSMNQNMQVNNNGGAFYSFTVLDVTQSSSLFAFMPAIALLAIGVIIRRKK